MLCYRKAAGVCGITETFQLSLNVGQEILPRGGNTCTVSDKQLGASVAAKSSGGALEGGLKESFKDHPELETRSFSGWTSWANAKSKGSNQKWEIKPKDEIFSRSWGKVSLENESKGGSRAGSRGLHYAWEWKRELFRSLQGASI